MSEDTNQMFSELSQLREQWQSEVGRGRRAWPKAIKTRVLRLVDLKVPRREIAAKSGVPYETINLWQHKRNKSSNNLPVVQKKDFHDISVENEIATVTVTDFKSQIILKTPKGYKISGLTQDSLLAVLKKLGRGL